MTNNGQTPPDFSTPIGQFRLLAQDVNSVPLSPVVAGQGSFDLFSDSEISGYINMYDGYSMYRAVAAGYTGLAARAAMSAKIAKDYDLQVDLSKRADALREIAAEFLSLADDEDLRSGALSTFGITAPDAQPSLAELAGLTIEQWAFLNGVDIPTYPLDGIPPYLW